MEEEDELWYIVRACVIVQVFCDYATTTDT